MKRNLCYRHHTAEFDKLPNAHRHLAADWRTVEPCEICEEERVALLAALKVLFTVLAHVDTVYKAETGRTIEQDFEELEQARAALAGARGEGGEQT
jgi:ATP-dependent exoDNAse (exonuclease V) beta subunit